MGGANRANDGETLARRTDGKVRWFISGKTATPRSPAVYRSLEDRLSRRRKGKGKKLVPSIQSPKSAGGKHANESSLQIISPIRSPLRSAVTRSPIKPCNNMMPDAPNSARGANKTGEAGCNKGWLGRFRKSMQTKIVRWQRRHSVAGDFQDLRKLVHLSEHRRSSLKEERLASRGRTPDLGDLPDLPEFLLATEDVDALLDTHHQEREECEAELRAWGLSPTVSSIPEEIDLSLERSDSKNSVNSNIDVEEMHIDFEDSEASAESVEIILEGACREAAASAIPFPVGHPTNHYSGCECSRTNSHTILKGCYRANAQCMMDRTDTHLGQMIREHNRQ